MQYFTRVPSIGSFAWNVFKPFSHRVVYPSSIYGFWLALWYLQSLLTTLVKLLFSLDHRDFMEKSALFTKAFETLWLWILLETVDKSVSNPICNDIMEGSTWKVSKCYLRFHKSRCKKHNVEEASVLKFLRRHLNQQPVEISTPVRRISRPPPFLRV